MARSPWLGVLDECPKPVTEEAGARTQAWTKGGGLLTSWYLKRARLKARAPSLIYFSAKGLKN